MEMVFSVICSESYLYGKQLWCSLVDWQLVQNFLVNLMKRQDNEIFLFLPVHNY